MEEVQPSPIDETRSMLVVATESIASVSGMAETVADVLHLKALRHYSEGLRQYLALRLGDLDAAEKALVEVRGFAAAMGANELVQPPGIRARLFSIARQQVPSRKKQLDATMRRGNLPWRQPGPTATDSYLAGLAQLRTELPQDAAEILELRYARELPPSELAYVLDDEEEKVTERLESARATVAEMLGDTIEHDAEVESAIIEAFALDTKSDTIDLDGDTIEALAVGTVIGARYEIQERVGSGAFSDVYRASDTEVPGHMVALKLLHQASLSDAAKQAALRELHLIASVFHPSVVQFKDHGWHDGRLWFVMPWYEGESLEARIGHAPLKRHEARAIFEPLARALATMHAAGIRHQDVKPENVLLARLKGFGLDKATGVLPVLLDLGVAAKEAEMVVAGTPTYFAPEVAAQFAHVELRHAVTTKADVFSLALALRNALEPDTQDDVPAGAVEHFIQQRAQNLPEMPLAKDLRFLRPHFARWMSLNPDERPTADEFADELAVLTRPEDRRKRIAGVMRWLGPLLMTLAVVFGATFYALNQQARIQKLEAARARGQAADALADLNEESDRRRALEKDVQKIEAKYQTSRLTRLELASRLGAKEGQLARVRGSLSGEQRRNRSLTDKLAESRGNHERVQGELDRTEQNLVATRISLNDERSLRTRLENDLARARGNLDQAQTQVNSLSAQVNSFRGSLEAERARATVLNRRMTEAENARTQAEQEITDARRRVRELERQLAELQRRRGSSLSAPRRGTSVPPPSSAPPIFPPDQG